MVFNTMFHPLSCTTNIGHTESHGLGYKEWHSWAMIVLYHMPKSTNHNIIQQKDTMILYKAQTCHPLNNHVLTIFYPFATISAMVHYLEFTDKCSPQYVGDLFHCFSWITSFFQPSFSHFHPSLNQTANLLHSHHPCQQPIFPFPDFLPSSLPCTLNQQQNTIFKSSQIFSTVW